MAAVNMELAGQVAAAEGLRHEDKALVRELMDTWRTHRSRNMLREDYYLGHIGVKDLGIAMPKALAKKINPRVDWPKKAVHALADRSVFNGFTADDEDVTMQLRDICADNQLEALYRKNLIGELKHCCGFWTVTDGGGKPIISAYPATAAAAIWDDAQKRIKAGLVVAESKKMPGDTERVPTVVHLLTEDARWCLRAAAATGWPTTWSTAWVAVSWSPCHTMPRSSDRSAPRASVVRS